MNQKQYTLLLIFGWGLLSHTLSKACSAPTFPAWASPLASYTQTTAGTPNYFVDISGALVVQDSMVIGTDCNAPSSNTLTINAATTFNGPVNIPNPTLNGLININASTGVPNINSTTLGNCKNGGPIVLATLGNFGSVTPPSGVAISNPITLQTTPCTSVGSINTNFAGDVITLQTSGAQNTATGASGHAGNLVLAASGGSGFDDASTGGNAGNLVVQLNGGNSATGGTSTGGNGGVFSVTTNAGTGDTPGTNGLIVLNTSYGTVPATATGANIGSIILNTSSAAVTSPASSSIVLNTTGTAATTGTAGGSVNITAIGGAGTTNASTAGNAGNVTITITGGAATTGGTSVGGNGGIFNVSTTGGTGDTAGSNGLVLLSTSYTSSPTVTGANIGSMILNTASSSVTSPAAQSIVLNSAARLSITTAAGGLYITPSSLTTPTGAVSGLVINTSTGQVFMTGSSRVFKTNIKYLNDVENSDVRSEAAGIYKLQPCTFRYKTNPDEQAHEFGLIAEDLRDNNIMPSAICYNDKGEVVNIHYQSVFVAMLYEFIQLKKDFNQLVSILQNSEGMSGEAFSEFVKNLQPVS